MKDHLLRFNKYPKLADTLRRVAKAKNIPLNELLNDALLEWLLMKWNKMTDGIEYFKNLSIKNDKMINFFSGLSGVLVISGLISGLILVFISLMFNPSYNYIIFPIVCVLIVFLLIQIGRMEGRCSSGGITKKIYKLGLKLVSLKIPEDSEYMIYHTKNGDFYLLMDLKTLKVDDIKIPSNAEKIVISQTNSQFLLAFQK